MDSLTYDKYWNTRCRLATGGGNEGYGHKILTAYFVDVVVDCCMDAELVAPFGHTFVNTNIIPACAVF